ncbi:MULTISPECIES: RNA-binding cell elongation regulator Jag/EloR [unclassified Sporosarcina]|uniref:RNA-binding cell elongation regulator Jag/EloR n=1 Tax=unclassified Sporosarcina TaxID=2647733 RepID=UPI00203D037F|nr:MULTISPECIES: RNA-binding cell elongation regulator Jag/EloR [unclassified Sporosarcina]GKV67076.1 RNA-binding protein [Sporosarcina sp. NCCP-2331]GLB57406.1 RNA-binding protein [Sporosarcina sp. NCCP-2378]
MKQLTQRAATVELAIKSALQDLGVTKDEVEIEVLENGRKGFLGFGAKDAEVLVTVTQTEVKPESVPSIKEEKPEPETSVILTEDSEVPPLVTEPAPQAVLNPEPEIDTDEEPEPAVIFHEAAESTDEDLARAKKCNEQEAIEETKCYIDDMAKEMGITDLVITCETKGKYMNFHLESEKAAFLIGKRGQTLNAIQQLAQLVTNKVTNQFKIVRVDVGDYRERREQSLEQLADRMADRAIRTRQQVALEPMPSYERKVIHNALSRRLDVETFSDGKDPYRHIVIKGIE